MPTRSYDEFAAERRASWKPEAHDLARRLSAELDAEISAQETLGKHIATARQKADLSQPQLAQLTGIQQADISRIERGLGNPTRDTLLKLANALDMRLILEPKSAQP